MAATDQQRNPVMNDPLRHHKHYQQGGKHPSPYAGGSSFMERMAESVASAMGTVQFVLIGSLIILAWVVINGAVKYLESTGKALSKGGEFDPEPWILLNLIFSGVAFYTGALVIIAQKAQTRTQLRRPGSAVTGSHSPRTARSCAGSAGFGTYEEAPASMQR
jgi:uncharacterized membrane protein